MEISIFFEGGWSHLYPFFIAEDPKKITLVCPWVKLTPMLFMDMNITNITKRFRGDMKTRWNSMCFGQGRGVQN